MRWPSCVHAGATAVALLLPAASAAAQPAAAPEKTYTVELDAEKDYFANGAVKIIAKSRAAGEVQVGAMDVTIRRTKTIAVPADANELIFRTEKDITARLRLPAATGKITVRRCRAQGRRPASPGCSAAATASRSSDWWWNLRGGEAALGMR